MKILITGAGGFVGKRLVRDLADKGNEVIALIRSQPRAADRHYFLSKNIRLLELDLSSLDCRQLPRAVDVLYTLAQSAHFREFPEKAEDVFGVNVAANFLLWQWAAQSGVRKCIHVSSGGIYGGKSEKVFDEDELLAVNSPLGFYLGTKLCSEIVFQNYKDLFETAVILRPFFIYGPGQRKDMFIARMIESVREGKPIQLQGWSGLRVNPVYVNDAVIAFANSLGLSGSHIINVAGPDVLYLRQIADVIGRELGKEPVFEMKEDVPIDYVGKTNQALTKLNQPITSFQDGISRTIRNSDT
jgi:nucleoside-diphosphate-sugar epimerase